MTGKLSGLFLLITAIGAAHMGEQLLTSIEEFYMLRAGVMDFIGLFPPAYADHGGVILITFTFLLVSTIFYLLMCGGRTALYVVGCFGLFGVTELHHVIEAVASGAYDPGVITSVFYAFLGALIVREVWRELQAPGARQLIAA